MSLMLIDPMEVRLEAWVGHSSQHAYSGDYRYEAGERLCWCQRVTSHLFAATAAPDSKRFEPLAELLSVPLDVWSTTGAKGTIV